VAVHTEQIADRVWRLSGDLRHGMNLYFIEEDEGVVQFDAAVKSMTKGVAQAAKRFGGINRVVLGHAHSDHRGTAPGLKERLGVPVHCHPAEVSYAEADNGGCPDYWRMDLIPIAWSRIIYPSLHRRWDGGPVKIDDTVSEGDEVAGFKVVHFPGHAPGLIGLWRESDRLALVSDTVYFIDSIKLKRLPEGDVTVPHPVFNQDTPQAQEAVRKLASLKPATVWAGHGESLEGPDLADRLEAAADREPPKLRDRK
jgi:glyoxylase-like metal-dependent hydrolase (beta-lactamase superfamily II)